MTESTKYSNSVTFMAKGIDEKMEGKKSMEFESTSDTSLDFLESLRFCLMDMGYKVLIYKELGSFRIGVWA